MKGLVEPVLNGFTILVIESTDKSVDNKPKPNWKNNKRYGPKQPEHNINRAIRHPEVRVTGEGIESQVVSIQEAQRMADELGLDLVEIASQAQPPVCKIVEYGKFLYELKRKKKEIQKNTQEQKTKEMQLTPNIGEADIQTKCNHAREWLSVDGDKVRCIVLFKGRNIVYKDKGEMLLLKIYQLLEDVAKAEQLPKLEGKRMSMVLSPKNKKK